MRKQHNYLYCLLPDGSMTVVRQHPDGLQYVDTTIGKHFHLSHIPKTYEQIQREADTSQFNVRQLAVPFFTAKKCESYHIKHDKNVIKPQRINKIVDIELKPETSFTSWYPIGMPDDTPEFEGIKYMMKLNNGILHFYNGTSYEFREIVIFDNGLIRFDGARLEFIDTDTLMHIISRCTDLSIQNQQATTTIRGNPGQPYPPATGTVPIYPITYEPIDTRTLSWSPVITTISNTNHS